MIPRFLCITAHSNYIEIRGRLCLKEDHHLTDAMEMLDNWFQKQTMVVDALFLSESVSKKMRGVFPLDEGSPTTTCSTTPS